MYPSLVEWHAHGVSIDTRTLSHGDIFVAIRGDRLDGHDYISNAFENGAAVAIVAADAVLDDISGVDETHLIRVMDTQDALEKLGQAARNRHVRTGGRGDGQCWQNNCQGGARVWSLVRLVKRIFLKPHTIISGVCR
jgi:hypothetical protein